MRLIKLILPLLTLLLLQNCSNIDYTKEATALNRAKCREIKTLPITPPIDVNFTKNGGLDHNNTIKVLKLIKRLRIVEQYYYNTLSK